MRFRKRLVACTAVAAAGAGLLVARRGAVAARLADIAARRPSGPVGRWLYREPKAHRASFRATLDALTLTRGDRLLELGCGGGSFLEEALASGCTAKAVDHSPDMVALAGNRNRAAVAEGRLEILHADAKRLPCDTAAFTAVASTNAFFFFESPMAVLREAHRVLAPGGRIAIFTCAPGAPRRIAPPPLAERMHCYTDAQLRQMLEDAGFEDIDVQRSGSDDYGQLAAARRPLR